MGSDGISLVLVKSLFLRMKRFSEPPPPRVRRRRVWVLAVGLLLSFDLEDELELAGSAAALELQEGVVSYAARILQRSHMSFFTAPV